MSAMRAWPVCLLIMGAFAVLALSGPVEVYPVWFLAAFGTASAAYLCALWLQGLGAPERQTLSLGRILAVAVSVRLMGLSLPGSDDVFRYLWEGSVSAAGFNPYLHAPSDALLGALRPGWHAQINHPDIAAAYGPVAEAVFAAHAWAGGGFFTWRLLTLCADLMAGWLLVRSAERFGRSPRYVALAYLWNPLAVFAFSFRGHLDAFLVLGMAVMLHAHAHRRHRTLLVAAACCANIKAPWLAAVPWALALAPKRYWWVLPAALAAPWAFFGDGFIAAVETMRRFAAEFHYNDGAHALLAGLLGGNGARLSGLFLLFLAGLCAARGQRRENSKAVEGLALLLGLCVLLSPTVHPWYGTWVGPAVALMAAGRARLPWLALSLCAGLGYGIYLVVRPGESWQELPLILRLLVHAPPWLLLAATIFPRVWKYRNAVPNVSGTAPELSSTVR
ncbi:MAG: hypothetical protein L6R28_18005 [Planctomycetes bacterium]|nr:hypothetical protein [Planctomycetota bacterium]